MTHCAVCGKAIPFGVERWAAVGPGGAFQDVCSEECLGQHGGQMQGVDLDALPTVVHTLTIDAPMTGGTYSINGGPLITAEPAKARSKK